MTLHCIHCQHVIWDNFHGYPTWDKIKLQKISREICPWCNKPYTPEASQEIERVNSASLKELPLLLAELHSSGAQYVLHKRLKRVK